MMTLKIKKDNGDDGEPKKDDDGEPKKDNGDDGEPKKDNDVAPDSEHSAAVVVVTAKKTTVALAAWEKVKQYEKTSSNFWKVFKLLMQSAALFGGLILVLLCYFFPEPMKKIIVPVKTVIKMVVGFWNDIWEPILGPLPDEEGEVDYYLIKGGSAKVSRNRFSLYLDVELTEKEKNQKTQPPTQPPTP